MDWKKKSIYQLGNQKKNRGINGYSMKKKIKDKQEIIKRQIEVYQMFNLDK